jgi:2'-5' RNA ligase
LTDFPDNIRAFIALRMSAEVEGAIIELVDKLREFRSGIRWVRRANLHLTLRFLGDEVGRNLLVELDRSLNEIAAETSPFVVAARGTGAFPNMHRPRAIWIGLVNEELSRLAQLVEEAAVRAGFAPEARRFTPHLTIGRARDLHGWERVRDLLDQPSTQDFGSSLIGEMILYRSILGREASQYQPLVHYPFTASAP